MEARFKTKKQMMSDPDLTKQESFGLVLQQNDAAVEQFECHEIAVKRENEPEEPAQEYF
jgi:hypothetical protein